MSDLNELINQAVVNHELNTTPNPKRKAVGQLSAEKGKPNKLPSMAGESDHREPQGGARPKALRVPASNLNGVECVASFSMRNAILKKDASHNPPPPPKPTVNDLKEQIGDKISSKQHLLITNFDKHLKDFLVNLLSVKEDEILANLDKSNPNFINMYNELFTIIQKFIVDFKICESTDPLANEAITSIASLFTTNASTVIQAHRENIDPYFSAVNKVATNDSWCQSGPNVVHPN